MRTIRPTRSRRGLLARLALATATLGGAVLAPVAVVGAQPAPDATSAPAAEPTPWVVSLGDSYISGEGGRWAGNQTGPTTGIDALGSSAYYDDPNGTGELIPKCHRSKSAAIHIGGGVKSLNLACSGATTGSTIDDKGNFKPGIDFADLGGGRHGQARMLQEFATEHPVKMVVLSIGGNDFNFGPIVEKCVKDFLVPSAWGWWPTLCSEDSSVTGNVTSTNAAAVTSRIEGAISNVKAAMRGAGMADDQWSLIVNTYPRVLPYPDEMRFTQGGYERFYRGGCGISDPDLKWALNNVLGEVNRSVHRAVDAARRNHPTSRIAVLENSVAFHQRGLCDLHVDRVGVGSSPLLGYWLPGASDRSEWVTEINGIEVPLVGSFEKQESLHPNFWGQLALRNCIRQVWNDGNVVSGTCYRGTGQNAHGEPNMVLLGDLTTLRPSVTANRYVVTAASHVEPAITGVLSDDVNHPKSIAGTPVPLAPRATAVAADTSVLGAVVMTTPERSLSATVVDEPAHGRLRLAPSGAFVYEPEAGFSGTDSFTYVATSFHATSEPATVTLEVTPAEARPHIPVAPARPTVVTPAFTG